MAAAVAGKLQVVLGSGAVIPRIGLGVYQCSAGKETFDAVTSALKLGYRHIDTAQYYRNEKSVGEAVLQSGIKREDIFVTSKLWLSEWGYERASAAVKRSVANLNLGYIDLFLLHAPGDPELRAETWKALEDCQQSGLLKDIGVSNFGEAHLNKLAKTSRVKPAVNQIEVHPWLQRRELVQYCKDNGIHVQAYSPLARVTKINDPVLVKIAKRINKSPAQVLVAWSLLKVPITLPKSINPDRQEQNLAAASVELSAEDVAALDALDKYMVTGWDPVANDPV